MTSNVDRSPRSTCDSFCSILAVYSTFLSSGDTTVIRFRPVKMERNCLPLSFTYSDWISFSITSARVAGVPIPPECDSSSSNASLRSLSSTKREACSIAASSVASVNGFGGFVSPFLIVAVPSGDKTTSRPGSRFEGMTLHYSLFLNFATLLLFRFPFTRLHSYATRKMPESSSHDSTVNRENILFKKSKTPRLVPVTRIAWWMEGTELPRNGTCARWVSKKKPWLEISNHGCSSIRCPRWDSNPHCTDFEAVSSTNWDTGAFAQLNYSNTKK